MTIVLAGGTGFLGRALSRDLAASGHDVCILSRGHTEGPASPRVRVVPWTPSGASGPWATAIDGADAIVNLAGAGIADRRWTPARKRMLVDSRLQSTASLMAAIQAAARPPAVFVQNCAVGYYGFTRGDEALDEHAAAGDDFLARLCVEWERAALPVADLGCRLVVLRTGVVLSPAGGALPQMMRPFRFFAGGPMGSGRQFISWIHIEDWVHLMVWAMTSSTVSGPLNATAPDPARNRDLAHAIGQAMHRPSLLPVPGFVLRLVVGEMADAALLGSQRVVPKRARDLGFTFRYRDVQPALESLLGA